AERRERTGANNHNGGFVTWNGGKHHPYVSAAIDRELEAVRTNDRMGTQNPCLHIAALKIGSLLAGIAATDEATISGAKEKLGQAAGEMPTLDPARPWDSPDGERAALKTIESGLKYGLEHPRDMSGVKSTAQPHEPYTPQRPQKVKLRKMTWCDEAGEYCDTEWEVEADDPEIHEPGVEIVSPCKGDADTPGARGPDVEVNE